MGLTFELRFAAVLVAAVVALVGATGFTEAHLFHQASTLRYALTVVGPLFIGVLAMTQNPVVVVSGLLIVAAPFAGYSMTVHDVRVPLLAPILILGVLAVVLSEQPSAKRSWLAVGGALFLLAMVIPVVNSPIRADVVAVLASLFASAYVAARASATRRGFLILAWAFLGSAALQAGLTVWEEVTGRQLTLYALAGTPTFSNGYFFGYFGRIRPPGAFYDPISLGNVLAFALPVGLGLAIHSLRRRAWPLAGVAFAASALLVVALEITLSRMSWVAAAAGLVVAAVLLPSRARRTVLPAIVLVVAILAVLGVFSGHSTAVQRLGSILHPYSEIGTANGDVTRVQIWQHALSIAIHHPLAGVGLGRFGEVLSSTFPPAGIGAHAHSTYLQLAAEGGAIALLGLIAVLVSLGRDLGRLLGGDRLWGAALAGSCVALLIGWVTDVTIRYSNVAACAGILFGMVAGRARSAPRDAPT